MTTFNTLLETIARKHGLQTMSDQVNLSLAVDRGCGLESLLDHVSIALGYLSVDEQTTWTIEIMDRVRDGIIPIDRNRRAQAPVF